jgi:predicted dehydrogenase
MRIALAGLGGAAMRGHLPALARLAQEGTLQLVGAADPVAERRTALARRMPDVPLFERADSMLDAVDADVFAIATEPRAHAPLAALGLARGLHVLCEKPLALAREQHELIARASAANSHCALVPVHQYRYSPTWTAISRWARRADRFGVPFTLTVDVERDGADRNAASPWRTDVRASGGMLADHGVHFIALGWTISENLEVLVGTRDWDSRLREHSSATARLGAGLLRIRVAGDAPGRSTRLDLRLPSVRFEWSDRSARLAVRGRDVSIRQVDALSDRRHVDALYVPLYREFVAKVADEGWRRRRRGEALTVSSALVDLLDRTG